MATTKTTNKQTAIITARKRNSKSNFWHTFGKHFSYNRKFPKNPTNKNSKFLFSALIISMATREKFPR